ncbi:hypothetical protein QZH56_08920 [Streptomyces olivoreticuli]|nr:hypothetical protein [Streptomyces olivoreticuli]WKK25693.1 hypothetical protein QZH56_08920 [Streptomyces olivoreticuli]
MGVLVRRMVTVVAVVAAIGGIGAVASTVQAAGDRPAAAAE